MMNLILAFALTEFLLCLSPGPAVLLISSQGARYGVKQSIYGIWGVILGNIFYFSVSALGLGAVILASAWLYRGIELVGALYLVFLGGRMLLSVFQKRLPGNEDSPIAGGNHLFLQAFAMQLGNPKAIVFFVALLPQFVTPDGNMFLQCFLLALVSAAIEFPVLLGYSAAAARGKALASGRQLPNFVEALGGTFLIGAGVKLAFQRR